MRSGKLHRSTVEPRVAEPMVVLLEAALRSLSRARQCMVGDDQIGRVVEVKKVTDIMTQLQATLRTELGRSVAVSLSDFYAAMFTLTLEASQCGSTEGLDEVIGSVSRVRDAWLLASGEPKPGRAMAQGWKPYPERAATMSFPA